jgi:menaquinone-dependent protoporphyrinogen oxidase
MSRILVIFGTHFGETCVIATRIAKRLREHGHEVDVLDAHLGTEHAPPADYDAVILGSRVEFGRFSNEVLHYVRTYRALLDDIPTAFFSVSMAAADGPQGIGHDPSGYLAAMTDELGWQPGVSAAFAGGLPYRKYNWFLRQVMRRINRSRTTDTSRNHVFTDNAAVDAFADRIASVLATGEVVAFA